MSDQIDDNAPPSAETLQDMLDDRTNIDVGRRLAQVWQLLIVLVIPIVLGALFLMIGKGTASHASVVAYSGLLLILFTSAFIAGGGAGLIFAIPRSRTEGAKVGDHAGRGLDTNTNLERISDWLTNGIVAIALVKLQDIGGALAAFGVFAGRQFPGLGFVSIVSQCVLVGGGISGFVFGYIQTRTSLTLTFNSIENALGRLRSALAKIDDTAIQDPKSLSAIAALRASVGQTKEAALTLSRAMNLQGKARPTS